MRRLTTTYYLDRLHGRFTHDCYYGSGRTGLTKFVWPFQKSRQNLSLPNLQFVKRRRTETQQNIC